MWYWIVPPSLTFPAEILLYSVCITSGYWSLDESIECLDLSSYFLWRTFTIISVMGAEDTTITASTFVKVLLTWLLPTKPFTYENNQLFFSQNFRILNSSHRKLYFLYVIRNQNQNHHWTNHKSHYTINLILLCNLCYLLMLMLLGFAPQN